MGAAKWFVGGAIAIVAACAADTALLDGEGAGGSGTGGASIGTGGTSVADGGMDSSGGTSVADGGMDSSGGTGGAMPCGGDLMMMWGDATACPEDPVQVHQYDDDTFILRQSLCVHCEGPFMYLLFGQNKVLLLDTGATSATPDIANEVYDLIAQWLLDHGQASIDLVVAHSHAHGDHIAHDADFQGQPNTTVVGTSVASVMAFFGIANWPTDIVTYDLGGRQLDVIPIPGHQEASIALYDHGTDWLLTGDTLYPGRLTIKDFPAYLNSLDRLVNHTAGLPMCNVMGAHIEMTNVPGVDFGWCSVPHPNEHELPLSPLHLSELRNAVVAMAGAPTVEVHNDFVIVPTGGLGTTPWADCMNNPATVCLPGDNCACDNFANPSVPATACICIDIGCMIDADCPPAPPGGTAYPACVDADSNNVNECILYCGNGETCPPGMTCVLNLACAWP